MGIHFLLLYILSHSAHHSPTISMMDDTKTNVLLQLQLVCIVETCLSTDIINEIMSMGTIQPLDLIITQRNLIVNNVRRKPGFNNTY